MSEYCERYEIKTRHKTDIKDKKLLKQLTSNTLFCQHCYKPFLKQNIKNELTTPYMALIDLISAVTFVIIPIAWITLILLFSILSFKDYIFAPLTKQSEQHQNYAYNDFDREILLFIYIYI